MAVSAELALIVYITVFESDSRREEPENFVTQVTVTL
jgi:hypothetical protein